MATKSTKPTSTPKEKKTVEKPISLAGPPLDDVLAALLNTKPIPLEKAKPSSKKPKKRTTHLEEDNKKETDE